MIRSNRPFPISTATLIINRGVHDNKALVWGVVAGTTATLPVATGSGARYRFVVGTASNANVVSATGSSFTGGYVQNDAGDTSAATADFMIAATGNNTFSPTTVGGGGAVGDWIQFEDIAPLIYAVSGAGSTSTDPSNRFSTV